MPYQVEEIKRLLNDVLANTNKYYYSSLNVLEDSSNYKIIMDYLTGNRQNLNGIQHDHTLYYWRILPELVKNIDNLSANQQRILDVIYHPDVFVQCSDSLYQILVQYATEQNSEKVLQAVYNEFGKLHFTQEDLLLAFLVYQPYKHFSELREGPVKQFLKTGIKTLNSLAPQSKKVHNPGRFWSLFYFGLLEETKPEAIKPILEASLLTEHFDVEDFVDYKQGAYIEQLLALIHNLSIEQSQQRLNLILRLLRKQENSTHIQKEALLSSKIYLDYYEPPTSKQQYESRLFMPGSVQHRGIYMPYSSVAINYVLEKDREWAISKIETWLNEERFLNIDTLKSLFHHLEEASVKYILRTLPVSGAIEGFSYYQEVIHWLTKVVDPAKYTPALWNLISDKSKSLNNLLTPLLADKDPEAEQKAIELLWHKKGQIRLAGVMILSQCASSTARDAMLQALNREKNEDARDIILESIKDSLPEEAEESFIEEMINAAQKRGKLDNPLESWLEEHTLPTLVEVNNQPLSIQKSRFFLYRMSRVKGMYIDIEARYILKLINKEAATPFAIELLRLYKDRNSKAEQKWILAVAALLGDDIVADKLRLLTNEWIEDGRHKMAEYGVGALALQGGNKALRWVEWYSRKYRTKKANVGAAAMMAIEMTAAGKGINIYELGDQLVPDFEFDGLFKHFEVKGEPYRAFIDSKFKISFFNDDNKKLKSLPVGADPSLKEMFKEIDKEIRDIVKSQSSRLEYYLIIQRRWTPGQWKAFFLNNPVMFIYATKLVWGIYDKQNSLCDTFICDEDTSLLNTEQKETELPHDKWIGIVHPAEMNPALLQQWRTVLYDLSVEQVFPQLDRKIADIGTIDLSRKIIGDYEGKQMKNESIRSTLEKRGWGKGPVMDAGMVSCFLLPYPEKKLQAVLEVEGVGAGFGWGQEEKLGRLYFRNLQQETKRFYGYLEKEDDPALVVLKEIPPIFFREVISAIELIKPIE